jgi:hypothetical protein
MTWSDVFSFRTVLVAASLLESFSASGLIVGWGGLYLLLKRADVYGYLCDEGESSCPERELRFSLLFALGSTSLQLGFVGCGPSMDFIGPKIVNMAMNIQWLIGLFVVAVAQPTPQFDPLPLGIMLFCFAGGGNFVSINHHAFLFKKVPIWASIFAGSFGFSSVIFPTLSVASLLTGASRTLVIFFLLCCNVLIFSAGWILFRYKLFRRGEKAVWEPIPWKLFRRSKPIQIHTEIETVQEAENGEGEEEGEQKDAMEPVTTEEEQNDPDRAKDGAEPINAEKEEEEKQEKQEEKQEEGMDEEPIALESYEGGSDMFAVREADAAEGEGNVVSDNHSEGNQGEGEDKADELELQVAPAWEVFLRAFCSLDYLGSVAYLMFGATRLFYFLAVAPVLLSRMYSVTGVSSAAVLELGSWMGAFATITAPLNGIILHKFGAGVSYSVANWMSIAWLLLAFIPILELQLITLTIWGASRTYHYGLWFAFVGSRMPHADQGKLVAFGMLFNALGTFLQVPLVIVTYTFLNAQYLLVLFVVLVLSFVAFLHPLYFWSAALYQYYQQKKTKKDDIACVDPAEFSKAEPSELVNDEYNLEYIE